jgi:hypothetical protein
MGPSASTAIKPPQTAATEAPEERTTVNWSYYPMRLSTLVFSALILAVPAAASAQTPPPSMQGEGMHHFFTPEQREMYMEQNKVDFASMTPDQRRAQFEAMRAKFDAMSDADKMKLRADMQAKYDALTPDQKQAVEQKIAEHHGHHDHMQGSGQQQ